MGQLNYTTEKTNELLEKVNDMPETVTDGKTPVLETGTTTTLDPGQNATSEVVANGTDDAGNPKYKLNFGIPKGYDGAGGSGGGGTADSVQWANVLNKPSWVNSATKPTYTASEVGALPAATVIPSKTSQLSNDSGFTTSASFKTINGQSIVGSGNIAIEGGGGDTPSAGGGNVNVTNGSSLKSAIYYAFKPSVDGSLEGTFSAIPNVSSAASGLMSSSDYSKLADMKSILKVPVAVLSLTDESTKEEIVEAFGMDVSNIQGIIVYSALYFAKEYSVTMPFKAFIGNNECLLSGSQSDGLYTLDFNYVDAGKLKTISISTDSNSNLSCKLSESGGGSDDTYYLPINVYKLESGATKEEIAEAVGDTTALANAAIEGKKIYIKGVMGFGHGSVPVSVSTVGTVFTISFSEVSNLSDKCNQKIIYFTNTVASRCKIIYPEGYTLDSKVYQLTSTSTSDDISAAVGGESGLKAIIQAVNDGNRLVIRGDFGETPYILNTDVIVNIASIDESNGDMALSMFVGGFGFMNGYYGFGLMVINYTKSSNTFGIQVFPLQFGS